MNTLGVILARAGSVGLPGKHLLLLRGRPVLSYTLDHALASRKLSRIIISSDCSECRKLAESRFIETINRPAELATSQASVQDVLLHALDTVEARSPMRFDAVVTLYGNVPLRPTGLIDRAIDLFEQTHCDSVRSFCPVGKWHPQWMCELENDMVMGDTKGIHRRQDLKPIFLHDGGVVVASRDSMETARKSRHDPHAFFGTDRRAIRTEDGEVVEIDSRRDLLFAQACLMEMRVKEAA